MSKSVEGSYINLTDDLETIRKRLASATTDSGTVGGELPKEGPIAQLFKLLKLFVPKDMYTKFEQDYREKKIRYVELKEVLSQAIYKELEPFQKRRKEFESNPKLVDKIIGNSLEQCRQMAEETMQEVRAKMGLV